MPGNLGVTAADNIEDSLQSLGPCDVVRGQRPTLDEPHHHRSGLVMDDLGRKPAGMGGHTGGDFMASDDPM